MTHSALRGAERRRNTIFAAITGSGKSARNCRHRPDERKEAGLDCLWFNLSLTPSVFAQALARRACIYGVIWRMMLARLLRIQAKALD